MGGDRIKYIVLKDGVLDGVKVYYTGMTAKKARKVGTKLALCKVLGGEKVDVIFVDENNVEPSPWKRKLRDFLKRVGGCYETARV